LNEHEDHGSYDLPSKGLLRAYANIVFDNCFMIRGIEVIESTIGLFVSFPAGKAEGRQPLGYCFSGQCQNDSAGIMAEYEKIVHEANSSSTATRPYNKTLARY
jgi:DNA-binding cell septation regulator SpoVG